MGRCKGERSPDAWCLEVGQMLLEDSLGGNHEKPLKSYRSYRQRGTHHHSVSSLSPFRSIRGVWAQWTTRKLLGCKVGYPGSESGRNGHILVRALPRSTP